MTWDRIVELCAQVGTVLGLAALVWSLARQSGERRRAAQIAYAERLKETSRIQVTVAGEATRADQPRGIATLRNTSIFPVRDVRLDVWAGEHAERFEDAGADATRTHHWPHLEVDQEVTWTFGETGADDGHDGALVWRLEFIDHSDSRWQRDLGQPPHAIGGPAATIPRR